MRVRLFVDFWNFQLTLNEVATPGYKLDWNKLSPVLVGETSKLFGQPMTFEETRVYMSYDPKREEDRNLVDWAYNVLDRFPGVQVIIKKRRKRNSPTCQSCHTRIESCPRCGNKIARTIEKGIDTAIVTDLISLAWESAWDTAILLSSDHDFIPAVEGLAIKGFRVINAHFPPIGMDLARTCWATIDISKFLEELRR